MDAAADIRSALADRLLKALRDLAGDLSGVKVLAAFSGGADSSALVQLLVEIGRRTGLRSAAAHLDHGLRGDEGARDREFCRRAAVGLEIEYYSSFRDCRVLAAQRGLSLEEACREARYEFLEEARAAVGADFIATAHTADDNAEAVLMNLLRGAGPRGLAGIPPRRGRIVRPLLGVWRVDLLELLARDGIEYVSDSSNLDESFTRNRIRRDLMPRLEKDYNPAVKQALVRTAAVIRAEEDLWDRLAAEDLVEAGWREEDGRAVLDAVRLADMDRARARRLVRRAVKAAAGTTRRLTLDHVEAVLDLAAAGSGAVDLPGDLRAEASGGRLDLGRPRRATAVSYRYELALPGVTLLPEIDAAITSNILPAADAPDPRRAAPLTALLDLDRTDPPLEARPPRPGDRFQPLGMAGAKKLSDFFIDSGAPAVDRPLTPIVADARGIVWVGGMRPDHRVRLTEETTRVLSLSLRR